MMLQKLVLTYISPQRSIRLNTQCNEMEGGRGHLIPLTSLEKSDLQSGSAACSLGIVPGLSNTD